MPGEEPNQREVHLNVRFPEQLLGGVWSNFARVSHSEHEFTIDFLRLDYASVSDDGEMQGVAVARVGLSPLFVTQLITALQNNWSKFAEKSMPREVHSDDPDVQGD